MNASSSLERQVTEWLHSRAVADGAAEVLVASLAQAASVRQERSKVIPPYTTAQRFVRPMIAATALAIAITVVAVTAIPPLPRAASAKVTGVWATGPDVAFTAVLPPAAPTDIYWRVIAYDTWSSVDRAWQASDETVTPVDPGSSILGLISEPRSVGKKEEISVTIVPSQPKGMVVSPGIPASVDRQTEVDTAGPGGPLVQVSLSGPGASYRVSGLPVPVYSSSNGPAAGAAHLAGLGKAYPQDVRMRYARPPEVGELGPEADAFMRAVAASAGNDPYEIAVRIIEAFQSPQFTYVVDTRDVDCGADGFTECFLRVKRGYCVYFATAMVMLLRQEGIPARFVEGFLPGERVGTRETVRTYSAHAWVEAFFPGYGWVAFDPTPAQRPASAQ